MDKKEQEFKRKAFGVIDSEKEMQLLQGPFKPSRVVLATPFSAPDVIMSFCARCGDYGLINERGVALLGILVELYGMEEGNPEDLEGYFVELEVCPKCNPEDKSMHFKFRKVSEVED